MADQVFDLTQTGQQVQDIINDANKVKGAGDQTTLTTESVLLKDINGNYHKILKSSFTEAIRDTLAGLLVNNDKGTTINRIAAIANGDFGSITPANLASVLGGFGGTLTEQQLNDDLDKGWYYSSGSDSATNVTGEDGVLFVFPNGNVKWKLKISMGQSAFGIAVKRGNSSWKTWREAYQV